MVNLPLQEASYYLSADMARSQLILPKIDNGNCNGYPWPGQRLEEGRRWLYKVSY